MVVNHIDKIFVTSDAATILNELEVQHPAAKMIVMASKMQEDQCGDGTNLVVTLAGQLLTHAQNLIRQGLHPTQIIQGYEAAGLKALQLLQDMSVYKIKDLKNVDQISMLLEPVICSKLSGYSKYFSNLIAKSCIKSLPSTSYRFQTDNIRTVNIFGGKITDSFLMSGMVIKRVAEGNVQRVNKPKICVYGCPLDTEAGQTKGTVLIKNAKDMMSYVKGEQAIAQQFVQKLVDAGVSMVVSGGSVSNLCLHYLQKYQIMVVKITSKFDIKRIAKATSSQVISKLVGPKIDDIGSCDSVSVEQIGSEKVVVFRREDSSCLLSTIVLRGSSKNFLQDAQRSIDDALGVFKSLIKQNDFCAGGGSTQMVSNYNKLLSIKLQQQAKKLKGLQQYSYSRYARSFEIIPKILAQNSGMNVNMTIAKLTNQNSKAPHGINLATCTIDPSQQLKVYDHLKTKEWAIKLASDAAITILKVDQIIIAKPSGGPKFRENKNWDQD